MARRFFLLLSTTRIVKLIEIQVLCVHTAHIIYERVRNREHTHNTHHIGIAINEFDSIFYGFIADESAHKMGRKNRKRVDVDANSLNAHNSHAIQMCFVMSIFKQFVCVCVWVWAEGAIQITSMRGCIHGNRAGTHSRAQNTRVSFTARQLTPKPVQFD